MALPNFRQSGSPGPMRKFSLHHSLSTSTDGKSPGSWEPKTILQRTESISQRPETFWLLGDALWLLLNALQPLDTHGLPGSRAYQCRQDQRNAHIRRKKSKELFLLFKLDVSVYFPLLQFTFSPGFPSVNNLTINEAIKLHKLAKKKKGKKTC